MSVYQLPQSSPELLLQSTSRCIQGTGGRTWHSCSSDSNSSWIQSTLPYLGPADALRRLYGFNTHVFKIFYHAPIVTIVPNFSTDIVSCAKLNNRLLANPSHSFAAESADISTMIFCTYPRVNESQLQDYQSDRKLVHGCSTPRRFVV